MKKKMFNINSQLRNSYQNYNEIPLHTHYSGYHQNHKITSAAEDVEKLEPLHIAGVVVKWYSHCGNQYGGSSKN
jgi:hypothetical protein